MARLDSGEVAEWLKAPHSKFGDGDNLADYAVPTRLNKLFIFEHGLCQVLPCPASY
jgi:hypothetical protein